MIYAMRNLALWELNRRCGTQSTPLSELRRTHGPEVAALLVESAEKIPRVYLLQADSQRDDVVRMWPEEMTQEKAARLPFVQRRTAAVGPVFKRTYKKNETPSYGPNRTTQGLTKNAFEKRGTLDTVWAPYFREVNEVLFGRSVLEYGDKIHKIAVEKRETESVDDPHEVVEPEEFAHSFEAALSLIPDTGPWRAGYATWHAYSITWT